MFEVGPSLFHLPFLDQGRRALTNPWPYLKRIHAQGGNSQTYYRGKHLLSAQADVGVVSCNVDGLTEAKLETLQSCMDSLEVGLHALQETHTHATQSIYVTARGYLVVLSGPAGDCHDFARVAFLVAP